jgi:hypothetical protein
MAAKKTTAKARTANDWNYPRVRDTQTLIRLRAEDKALLTALAEHTGLSMNDIVQMLVRREAARLGIKAS